MRKSSLGRRKSSAVNNIRMGLPGSESVRKSGIPVRSRGAEPTGTQSAVKSFPRSAFLEATPSNYALAVSQNLPASGLKPTRCLSVGDSSRMSSLGGTGKKKDMRYLMEKEWQQDAERFICSYFHEDPEGGSVIPRSSERLGTMTLNLFIDAINFLFKKLDFSIEITKANCYTEVPFLLKKMQYRGKVDKSLLQTVSAMHSWPYVLGILHFLVEMVKNLEVVTNNDAILFPEEFEEPEEDGRDPKAMLSFFNDLYDTYARDAPNFAEKQDQWIDRYIQETFRDEHEMRTLEKQAIELQSQLNAYRNDASRLNKEAEEKNDHLNELAASIMALSEFKEKLQHYLSEIRPAIEDQRRQNEAMVENINDLKNKRDDLVNSLNADNISSSDVNRLLKEKASLEESINSEMKRIENFREVYYQEDLEVAKQTKRMNEILRNFELLLAKCIDEPGMESLKIIGKSVKDIDETLLTDLKTKIVAKKDEVSNCVGDLTRQMKHLYQDTETNKKELEEAEKRLSEKNEEYENAYAEKRECDKKRNNEINILKKKINELNERKEKSVERRNNLKICIDNLEKALENHKAELEEAKERHSYVHGQVLKLIETLKKVRRDFNSDLKDYVLGLLP